MIANLSVNAFFSNLRRDVVLRAGLVSALASLIALLLLTTITWFFLAHRLEDRVEQSLIARHVVATTTSSRFTPEERSSFRRFRQSLPIRDEGMFALIYPNGETSASNVNGLECRDGFYDVWLDISAEPKSPSGILDIIPEGEAIPGQHDRFRTLAKMRDDHCLVFGRSLFEVDELRSSVRGLFIWLVPLCILPALLVSLYQSFKLRRRLRHFGTTVQALSDGDLAARMPVNGDDDIDRLAGTANRSFARLQESVNALKQLTSIIAHDLRAPLNRVSIPLDEALRANELGNTAVGLLKKVELGLDDARSIFDALLRISQIESGRRKTNFKEINLFEVAEILFEIYEPVVEEGGRTLKFEAEDKSVIVLGDLDLIRQAVVNLIENAARYTPEGTLIHMGVVSHSKHPEIYVKDNGPGIPEEEMPKVLQRLYRFEGSTSGKSGHGLGLSLVKAVAELHDGEAVLKDASPGLYISMRFGHQSTLPSKK